MTTALVSFHPRTTFFGLRSHRPPTPVRHTERTCRSNTNVFQSHGSNSSETEDATASAPTKLKVKRCKLSCNLLIICEHVCLLLLSSSEGVCHPPLPPSIPSLPPRPPRSCARCAGLAMKTRRAHELPHVAVSSSAEPFLLHSQLLSLPLSPPPL